MDCSSAECQSFSFVCRFSFLVLLFKEIKNKQENPREHNKTTHHTDKTKTKRIKNKQPKSLNKNQQAEPPNKQKLKPKQKPFRSWEG